MKNTRKRITKKIGKRPYALTSNQQKAIKKVYKTGYKTMALLAKIYGVSRTTIFNTIHR